MPNIKEAGPSTVRPTRRSTMGVRKTPARTRSRTAASSSATTRRCARRRATALSTITVLHPGRVRFAVSEHQCQRHQRCRHYRRHGLSARRRALHRLHLRQRRVHLFQCAGRAERERRHLGQRHQQSRADRRHLQSERVGAEWLRGLPVREWHLTRRLPIRWRRSGHMRKASTTPARSSASTPTAAISTTGSSISTASSRPSTIRWA